MGAITESTTNSNATVIKAAKKTLKKQESGSMKIKHLTKSLIEKFESDDDVPSCKKTLGKLITESDVFEVDGKVVILKGSNKKRKSMEDGNDREVSDEDKKVAKKVAKKAKKEEEKKKSKSSSSYNTSISFAQQRRGGLSMEAESQSREAKSNQSDSDYPRRNLDRLYCPSITYQCAIGSLGASLQDGRSNSKPCVPCAYKICNFGIARDVEFTKLTPNQRPEQCPRSVASTTTTTQKDDNDLDYDCGTMGYKRGMNVLTVGDGDFTFSLAVARIVLGDTNASISNKEQQGMVVATSYEDAPTLRNVYPDFDNTLNSFKSSNNNGGKSNTTTAIVGYKVDATRLNDTLPKKLTSGTATTTTTKSSSFFHRICWNFPCTAIGSGQDGQNDAMEQNKELVRKFVANALPYLDRDCGEIHMAHKTKPPYNQWGLEKVALEGIIGGLGEKFGELEYKGRVAFDRCTLPPYTPRKALDRKSFPCHDACFYVFGWKRGDGNSSSKQHKSPINHSTIPDCQKVNPTDDELLSSSSVMQVTEEVVEKIRSTHLQYAEIKAQEQQYKRHGVSSDRHENGNKRRKKR